MYKRCDVTSLPSDALFDMALVKEKLEIQPDPDQAEKEVLAPPYLGNNTNY